MEDIRHLGILVHYGPYSVPAYHHISDSARKKGGKAGLQNGSEWYYKRLFNPFHIDPGPHPREYPTRLGSSLGISLSYGHFPSMMNTDSQWAPQLVQAVKKAGAR